MEDNNSDTLLIFQSPGIEEWSKGRPLSNNKPQSAGGKLEKAFKRLGTSRQNYNITNTVQCFPGKQKPTDGKIPRDKQPLKKSRDVCAKWLLRDIEAHEYKLVIVFGSHAHKAVQGLGFLNDPRFHYVYHPTALGITNDYVYNNLIQHRE